MYKDSSQRLRNIWNGMKQRCNNPNHTAARWYHDKGIRVCAEWEKDFHVFERWALQNGYADNLTIDRIDSDGDYEPGNCRWITAEENRRRALAKPRQHYEKKPDPPKTPTPSKPMPISEYSERAMGAILKLAGLLPNMTEGQRQYLLGFAEGAAAMAAPKPENEKEE